MTSAVYHTRSDYRKISFSRASAEEIFRSIPDGAEILVRWDDDGEGNSYSVSDTMARELQDQEGQSDNTLSGPFPSMRDLFTHLDK